MKKIISILLCLIMLCGIIPMAAFSSSAAAAPINDDFNITNLIATTRSVGTPVIKEAPSAAILSYFYITIDGTKYFPGDSLPATVTAGQVVNYRFIFNRLGGYAYESDGTSSRSYVGTVKVNNQVQAAYVSADGCELMVAGRLALSDANINGAQQFVGPALPVHTALVDTDGRFTHTGLKLVSSTFVYRTGRTGWANYTNERFDSSYGTAGFALKLTVQVDPLFNPTGFIPNLTWNGISVSRYTYYESEAKYDLYFDCTITTNITRFGILDIDTPYHGTYPDTEGTVHESLELVSISYKTNSGSNFTSAYDIEEYFGSYAIQMGVRVKPAGSYTFNPDTVEVIIGEGFDYMRYVEHSDGSTTFIFTVEIQENVLTNARITDIASPVHGGSPDREGTAPEGLEITHIEYVQASDRSGEWYGTFDCDEHVGEDRIDLGIEIKAKPGYTFDPSNFILYCNEQYSGFYVNRGDGKYCYIFQLVVADAFVNPFVDVKESHYFYDAVAWAVMSGVTAGIDATHFGPTRTCTRAQAVSFIYRAAGSPKVTSTDNPFTDVKPNHYFYDAVLWAVENGITAGMSATKFAPNANCTRAQIVSFIHRWAGSPTVTDSTNPFDDVKEGKWFYAPVLWAVENNITAGMSATKFAPNNKCTRGQIVCFLQRWMQQGDLEIIAQPLDYCMSYSQEDATFNITVKGDFAPYSYEWQVHKDSTVYYETHKTNATTDSLSYQLTDYDFEDYRDIKVRCIVRNANGEAVYSEYANVYSKETTIIITQPENYQMQFSQEDASFTVAIDGGEGPYTYTWYVELDSEIEVLEEISSSKTSTFSYEFTDYDFEDYRNITIYCIIKNQRGLTVKTDNVTVFPK